MKSEDTLSKLLDYATRTYTERQIGEGNFGRILSLFDLPDHRTVCFKVPKFGGRIESREFEIQQALFDLGCSVAEPLEYIPAKHAFAMRLINGMNIDQVRSRGLKLSEDVTEALIEEIENATRYINHKDLAYRNVMVGDCVIQGDTIVDAVPYVIDFGMSDWKLNRFNSREAEVFSLQLRNLTV